MPRIFIALELGEETRRELARQTEELAVLCPRVRWVDSGTLHLTLKFIGEVPPHELPDLFGAVAGAAAPLEPFAIDICGLGVFPGWRAPKTVWAGAGDGAEEFADLAEAVDGACAGLGYPPETRLPTPHITLGRVRLPADAEGLAEAVESVGCEEYGVVDADAAVVFMSELRRGGPVYAPMFRAPLGRAPADG